MHAAIGTVARLYIHYNTMKHRMGRIVELLDVDLHDPRARLSLAVAPRRARVDPPVKARAVSSAFGTSCCMGEPRRDVSTDKPCDGGR